MFTALKSTSIASLLVLSFLSLQLSSCTSTTEIPAKTTEENKTATIDTSALKPSEISSESAATEKTSVDMQAAPGANAVPSAEAAKEVEGASIVLVSKDGRLLPESEKAGSESTKIETKDSAAAVAHAHGTEKHWSYEGDTGPNHWANLKAEFALCASGKEQSPVDLKFKKPKTGGKIEFNYAESNASLRDSGHALQIDFKAGNSVNIRGQSYELINMHIHSESEHTISGKKSPLEIHFVHKNTQGDLAVVGVLVKQGAKSESFDKILTNIPKEAGTSQDISVQASDFLPAKKTYYSYKGSLTTPPCTEGVNWNVFNNEIEMSEGQIAIIKSFYSNNARPVQNLNARKTLNY